MSAYGETAMEDNSWIETRGKMGSSGVVGDLELRDPFLPTRSALYCLISVTPTSLAPIPVSVYQIGLDRSILFV